MEPDMMGRNTRRGKLQRIRESRKKLLIIGILVIVIGIVALVFSGPATATNDFFGGFLLGFGIILLVAGVLLTLFAFYKVSSIEFDRSVKSIKVDKFPSFRDLDLPLG